MTKGRRVLIERPASHDCVFLINKTCSVYEARPTQCRTYPWWQSNIDDPQSWQAAAAVCEGIDHPSAPTVAAAEIWQQSQLDQENDAQLAPRKRRS